MNKKCTQRGDFLFRDWGADYRASCRNRYSTLDCRFVEVHNINADSQILVKYGLKALIKITNGKFASFHHLWKVLFPVYSHRRALLRANDPHGNSGTALVLVSVYKCFHIIS